MDYTTYTGYLKNVGNRGIQLTFATINISSGTEGGTRNHTPLREADFKSAASTIPPPRHYE